MRKKRLFLLITTISLLLVGSIGQSAALAEPISGPFEDIWSSINTLFQRDEGQQDQIDALQAQSDQQAALISELRTEIDAQKERTALLEEKVEPMEIIVQDWVEHLTLSNYLVVETRALRDRLGSLEWEHQDFRNEDQSLRFEQEFLKSETEAAVDNILGNLLELQNQINDFHQTVPEDPAP